MNEINELMLSKRKCKVKADDEDKDEDMDESCGSINHQQPEPDEDEDIEKTPVEPSNEKPPKILRVIYFSRCIQYLHSFIFHSFQW